MLTVVCDHYDWKGVTAWAMFGILFRFAVMGLFHASVHSYYSSDTAFYELLLFCSTNCQRLRGGVVAVHLGVTVGGRSEWRLLT